MTKTFIIAGLAATLAMPGLADAATATLQDTQGNEVGTVTLQPLAAGGTHVLLEADGLPAGTHAFHIHAVGECDAANGFKTAGGHWAPEGHEHGWNNPNGHHAGDMPNIHVPESGALVLEYFLPTGGLGDDGPEMLDEDGAAIVIHEGGDDYESDPAGAAGARIACGVITE